MKLDIMIKNLNESLIHYASLGGNELFHSNLLDFLANNEKDFFGSLFLDFGIELPENYSTEREFKHFDFVIKAKDTDNVILLLENKVKSIPYQEQLKRYEQNSQETEYYVLLTLIEPREELKKWKVVKYAEYIEAIGKNIVKIKNPFTKEFITKYCDYLNQLIAIVENAGKQDIVINYDKELIKRLKDIRLHSLVEKVCYSKFQNSLISKLRKENIKIYEIKQLSTEKDLFKERDAIFTEVGYAHSGFIEIDVIWKDKCAVFIMIQRGMLKVGIRDFSEAEKKKITDPNKFISVSSIRQELWNIIYPNTNDICKIGYYSPEVVYSQKNINKDSTQEQFCQQVAKEVLKYIKLSKTIEY